MTNFAMPSSNPTCAVLSIRGAMGWPSYGIHYDWKSGKPTAALDIEYFRVDPDHPHRSNHFDIPTDAGFLQLRLQIL